MFFTFFFFNKKKLNPLMIQLVVYKAYSTSYKIIDLLDLTFWLRFLFGKWIKWLLKV